MPSSRLLQGRAVLRQSNAKLFDLVCNNASEEQWAEWLMVPLEHAMAAGDLVLVNNLLAAGASWRAGWRGCHKRTLLCAAVQGGNVEVVEDVLKAGAKKEVDVRESTMARAPLHYAVENGHEAIVKLLLLSGAAHNCEDGTNILPIDIAVSRGHGEIVSLLLLRGVDKKVLNGHGKSLLHVAARKGHASVARALLVAGANPQLRDSMGFSALHFAARGGHVDVMRTLVRYGVDVVSRCNVGFTALHDAAYHNQPGAVDMLVESGGSVETLTVAQNAPLHMAAQQGSCGALVALLRHKANVHAKDFNGRSPLMAASMNLHLEAADLLLRWGADETIADYEGLSAVQLIGHDPRMLNPIWRRQDMNSTNSMRKLLANAPADRAWRRRGWFVLCRAFSHEARFGSANSHDGGGSLEKFGGVSSGTRATAPRKTQQTEGSISASDDGDGTDSTAETSADSTKSDVRVGSCSIVARVVKMEQESVFRIIVSFL